MSHIQYVTKIRKPNIKEIDFDYKRQFCDHIRNMVLKYASQYELDNERDRITFLINEAQYKQIKSHIFVLFEEEVNRVYKSRMEWVHMMSALNPRDELRYCFTKDIKGVSEDIIGYFLIIDNGMAEPTISTTIMDCATSYHLEF